MNGFHVWLRRKSWVDVAGKWLSVRGKDYENFLLQRVQIKGVRCDTVLAESAKIHDTCTRPRRCVCGSIINMVARAHTYTGQCNAASEQQPEGWRIVDPPRWLWVAHVIRQHSRTVQKHPKHFFSLFSLFPLFSLFSTFFISLLFTFFPFFVIFSFFHFFSLFFHFQLLFHFFIFFIFIFSVFFHFLTFLRHFSHFFIFHFSAPGGAVNARWDFTPRMFFGTVVSLLHARAYGWLSGPHGDDTRAVDGWFTGHQQRVRAKVTVRPCPLWCSCLNMFLADVDWHVWFGSSAKQHISLSLSHFYICLNIFLIFFGVIFYNFWYFFTFLTFLQFFWFFWFFFNFFFFFLFPDSAMSPPILMSCSSHTEACNIRNHRWTHLSLLPTRTLTIARTLWLPVVDRLDCSLW